MYYWIFYRKKRKAKKEKRIIDRKAARPYLFFIVSKGFPPGNPLEVASNPPSFLKTFYAAHMMEYCSMTEKLIPRLAALREKYLTPNALAQFEAAANDLYNFRIRDHSSIKFSTHRNRQKNYSPV